jgi:hypothetical protein
MIKDNCVIITVNEPETISYLYNALQIAIPIMQKDLKEWKNDKPERSEEFFDMIKHEIKSEFSDLLSFYGECEDFCFSRNLKTEWIKNHTGDEK